MAFSMVLYLLFPLFYKCVNRKGLLFSSINAILLIASLISLNFLIESYFPDKYNQIEIALRHSPMFVVGIYLARFSLENVSNKVIVLYWCGVVVLTLTLRLLMQWSGGRAEVITVI